MATARSALVSAGLIALAGALLAGFGVAGLIGAEGLLENVREIESNEDFGNLYLSLDAWGFIAICAGLAEATAALVLWVRSTQPSRLGALIVAYFGLPVAFFTLPLFRLGSVAVALLLLAAIWILSYRSGLPRR